MKKFLSLVLALVMTMSLVTISAGAKDFTDADAINYDEAIAVMSAVKVIDGYTDGSFKPQTQLNRGQAAKIICNLVLGPTTAAELHASAAPFKDVTADNVFAGYIAYCAKEGIVGGYADGTFKPTAPLTGYAFMKMLLGALGYDADIEGYNDPKTWSIAVAKQALGIGLADSLKEDFNGIKYVTREEACLYALNTLKATMVDYDAKTIVNVGDASVTVAGSTAKPVSWNNSNVQTGIKNDGNIDADGFVQFAEQYFTKLSLEPGTNAFGCPTRTWEYKGDDVGSYVNYDLLVKEYEGEVTGKDLYDELGKTTIEDYDVAVYIDGVDDPAIDDNVFNKSQMNKNNKKAVGATDNGVLTQVFVDSESKDITIAIINTYLAKAKADYNEKKDQASFTVYSIDKKTTSEYVKDDDDETMTVTGEDFAIAKDVKEDEFYLVQVADGEIQTIEKAEIVPDATLSAFKKGSNVVADGETYKYADTARYDVDVLNNYTGVSGAVNLKEKTYNIILDQYGYLIGIELVKAVDNYVFITGIDTNTSNRYATNNDASAIFLDGTMKTITYNTTKSSALAGVNDGLINTWCTYTVDKNDVYTLTVVAGAINEAAGVKTAQYHDVTSANIDKKHVSLAGAATGEYTKVYGNDSTVYLTGKVKTITIVGGTKQGVISDVTNVVTGVAASSVELWNEATAKTEADKNAKVTVGTAANAAYGAYTLYKNNGYIIASVVIGKDSASSDNLVYVTSSSVEQEAYDAATDEWTWTRKVALDGTETLLKEVSDGLSILKNMTQYNWYVVSYNGKGEVIDAKLASADLDVNEYVNTLTAIETAVNDKTTVLYEGTMSGMAKKPYLKGNTFYVDTTTNTGFRVAEDVKIVFIQTNDRKTTTTWDESAKNLESVVSNLNTPKGGSTYTYDVSAILKDGAAKIVVIRDLNDSTGNAGTGTTPTTPTTTLPNATDLRITDNASITVNGRYNNAYGKLYLQFSGLTANASEVKISGLVMTDPAGRVTYLDPITVDVQKTGVSNVVTLDVREDLVDDAKAWFNNAIDISGTATVAVNEWYVTIKGTAADLITGPATVKNNTTDVITFNVAMPAGVTKYSLSAGTGANRTVNLAATSADVSIVQSNKTAATTIKAKLSNTTTAPVLGCDVTNNEVSLTSSVASGATLGTGVAAAYFTASEAEATVSVGSSDNPTLTVATNEAVSATDSKIVVNYTVNGTAKSETFDSLTAATSNTVTLTVGNISKNTEVVVTGVKVQSKVTLSATLTATNLASGATASVKNGSADVDGAFVDAGTVLTVSVTGKAATAPGANVKLDSTVIGSITNTAAATTVTGTATVGLAGTTVTVTTENITNP